MWQYEHSIETDAAAEALWARWADVATWAEWNADIEKVELEGPFAAGSRITMTPHLDEPVLLRLVEVREHETFVDVAEFGGVVIRTMHRLERLSADCTRITYRTEITGPAAGELGPQVGPAITADFPETMAALARAAGGRVDSGGDGGVDGSVGGEAAAGGGAGAKKEAEAAAGHKSGAED
jgi:hypothetical protein